MSFSYQPWGSSMKRLSSSIALLLALCLPGCGTPGFGSIAPLPSDPTSADASFESADGEGQMASITPELIRAQIARRPDGVPAEVRELFGPAVTYTIGPGDVIGVIVYGHPELLPNAGAVISQQPDPTGVSISPGFIVSATGEIGFPYIGRTRLQGLTEVEAGELITRRLATFVKEPQVTVRVQTFRSQRAYLEGEVRTPGIQIFTDVPMTLAEAISRAGGITAAGDRSRVTVTRGQRTTVIDLPLLQQWGLDSSGIPLRNADVIYVGSRDDRRVYVMGEILRPSALPLRNGRLSLNEALGDAGGVNLLTSDTRHIYVIRNDLAQGRQLFHLDVKNPAALALADSFALQARDVVYVDSVPLVSWNRVISLILPAAQVVNLGSDATRR